ncbi:MAG: acyl-CoA dehydrogenase domain protein [Marmoricola sp.]|jgi:alkylation response protein AidB-like acyl-CoA dehydrogenase|nr:acyl-CoA dehydrogenase domain protein [Marmoricola sp.]
MDFEPTAEATEAADLAATILADHTTPERLRAVDAEGERFDRALWTALSEAGLVALTVPEDHDGSGLGLVELCRVLVEVGRTVAPVPLGTHAVTALAISQFGSRAQQARWLPEAASGGSVLTTALSEDRAFAPAEPVTRAENDGSSWLLTGAKVVVPAGTLAGLFVVPASTAEGVTVFLVHADDPGVVVTPQRVSDGDVVGRLELDRTAVPMDRVLGGIGGGAEVIEWLTQRLTVAVCAQQLGTLEGAMTLTSSYAKTREQFGRPIGTFQAVSQRLADGYIDVLGARLTMWQAAWKLSEGLPADADVAIAKLWAADAGHQVAHTTVHVHGGVGIDLDGEAHRYFTAAKRHEFTLGGTTDQARALGALLAHEPA